MREIVETARMKVGSSPAAELVGFIRRLCWLKPLAVVAQLLKSAGYSFSGPE
jgi:hypothetical protein